MALTRDESRAIAFIGLLLALAIAARLADGGAEPVLPDAEPLDLAAVEDRGRELRADEERRSRPLSSGERLDPNTAPAPELDRLPGIGPALADRIVADRERNGPFHAAADLLRVSGIGESTLERIRPHITVRRVPPPSSAVRARAGRAASGAVGTGGSGTAGTAARTRGAGRTIGAAAGTGADAAVEPVDVNRADAAALERIDGVGPVIAERIIAYRDSVGPFRTVADLENVAGIGPRTLERIRPMVRIRP